MSENFLLGNFCSLCEIKISYVSYIKFTKVLKIDYRIYWLLIKGNNYFFIYNLSKLFFYLWVNLFFLIKDYFLNYSDN